jgi:hypothetical protein
MKLVVAVVVAAAFTGDDDDKADDVAMFLAANPIPAVCDLVAIPTLKFPALPNIASSLSYCANCFLLSFFCNPTNSS